MLATYELNRVVSRRRLAAASFMLLPAAVAAAAVLLAPAGMRRVQPLQADAEPKTVWTAAHDLAPADRESIALTASVLAALSADGVAAGDHPMALEGHRRLADWLEHASLEACDTRTVACALTALRTSDATVGDAAARRAVAALRAAQWVAEDVNDEQRAWIGGAGRTAQAAPDLLSTALSLRALLGAGVDARDAYVRRAADYIVQCQRFATEGRDPANGLGIDHGGFCETPEPGARPSGSATCAAVTSLLAIGVNADDARIQAAAGWLERHYTLDAHPGAAEKTAGLYLYYFEFARAMTSLGRSRIVDRQGIDHDWRGELSERLIQTQRQDGSWRNPGESAWPSEAHSLIVTSYALRTLSQILNRVDGAPTQSAPKAPPPFVPFVRNARTGPI